MGKGGWLSLGTHLSRDLGELFRRYLPIWLGRRLGHSRLEKIRWLHLTPTRLEWPERFFKRHGDKTVFLARFIPVIPSAVATLLEGTTTLSWPNYLWLNLAGSAAYTTVTLCSGIF